jgi:hypothetical protein
MMNAVEFVAIVRRVVGNTAIRDTISSLEYPPGRRPAQDLVSQSNWFKALDKEQKAIVEGVIQSSVENAIFGFLSILDGVRVVEDTREKGSFELRFVKNGIDELISPSNDYLHELFK